MPQPPEPKWSVKGSRSLVPASPKLVTCIPAIFATASWNVPSSVRQAWMASDGRARNSAALMSEAKLPCPPRVALATPRAQQPRPYASRPAGRPARRPAHSARSHPAGPGGWTEAPTLRLPARGSPRRPARAACAWACGREYAGLVRARGVVHSRAGRSSAVRTRPR
jgi:hypothetical protein